MREVRMALFGADVHYSVVKSFTQRVKTRAVGTEVSKALNPAQQVIKIVNDELIATLGEPSQLNLKGEKPFVIMLVGYRVSGKTPAAAKLAKLLRSQASGALVAADLTGRQPSSNCKPLAKRSMSRSLLKTALRRQSWRKKLSRQPARAAPVCVYPRYRRTFAA